MMNRLFSPATLALALLMTLPMACGDDGGTAGTDGGGDAIDGGVGGGADADQNAPRTAFRASKLQILDPHIFLFSAVDLTSTVDAEIQTAIDTDDDDPPNNLLDLNVEIVFQPLDQAAATIPMAISFATCSAPLASTSCTENSETTVISATATNAASGTCLEEVAGTTTTYDQDTPVIPVPSPCFASNEIDVTVNLGGVTLPLKAATISATYSGDPATGLVTGLLRGYVTEADADNVLLPDTLPLMLGGKPLSDLLRAQDRDTDPSGAPANNGWWFYIAVEATQVPYTVQ